MMDVTVDITMNNGLQTNPNDWQDYGHLFSSEYKTNSANPVALQSKEQALNTRTLDGGFKSR
jgi:hypothetical protein